MRGPSLCPPRNESVISPALYISHSTLIQQPSLSPSPAELAQRENLLASVRNLGTVRGTTSVGEDDVTMQAGFGWIGWKARGVVYEW